MGTITIQKKWENRWPDSFSKLGKYKKNILISIFYSTAGIEHQKRKD